MKLLQRFPFPAKTLKYSPLSALSLLVMFRTPSKFIGPSSGLLIQWVKYISLLLLLNLVYYLSYLTLSFFETCFVAYPKTSFMCTWRKSIFCCLGESILKISIKAILYNVSFKAAVFLLIYCQEDISIDINGVSKSSTIIVLLSVSPFMSVNICFIYLGASTMGA